VLLHFTFDILFWAMQIRFPVHLSCVFASVLTQFTAILPADCVLSQRPKSGATLTLTWAWTLGLKRAVALWLI